MAGSVFRFSPKTSVGFGRFFCCRGGCEPKIKMALVVVLFFTEISVGFGRFLWAVKKNTWRFGFVFLGQPKNRLKNRFSAGKNRRKPTEKTFFVFRFTTLTVCERTSIVYIYDNR